MNDSKILSPDEVDEILKAAKDDKIDLTQLIGSNSVLSNPKGKNFSAKILGNITDLTWIECRNQFSNFTRRKMIFNLKKAEVLTQTDALQDKLEKRIYIIAKILPTNHYCMIVFDLAFLHQIVNVLFGGQVNENDPVSENPGKISLAIAEKIGKLVLDSFVLACQEYTKISYEIFKLIRLPNLITKVEEDRLYCMDMDVTIGSFESAINFMVDERFFCEVIPRTEEVVLPNTKNFWRSAIESQVVDSLVTVSITLPNIKISLKEFLEMKKDALLPISDPRSVYVDLNNIKIFRGNAGQLNDTRVVEIEREI